LKLLLWHKRREEEKWKIYVSEATNVYSSQNIMSEQMKADE